MRVLKSTICISVVIMGGMVLVLGFIFPYLPEIFISRFTNVTLSRIGSQLKEAGVIIIVAGFVSEMIISALRKLRFVQ